jgi:hypothetical protein
MFYWTVIKIIGRFISVRYNKNTTVTVNRYYRIHLICQKDLSVLWGHLNADHQKKLLQLLVKFESLFDGTLGDWKTKPVSFQLKECASPYHGWAIPVLKIHKDVLIKEIERLCNLGVLERQLYSEWASPSFIVPKKNNTVRFFSDFWEVNKRLIRIRKPFPIPPK